MKQSRTWMLLLLISATLPVRAAQVLAIKADRVDTVASGIIENGIIVIRNGRITAVGADITIPDDAEIIEAPDQTVFPGLVNPFSPCGPLLSRRRQFQSPLPRNGRTLPPSGPLSAYPPGRFYHRGPKPS